MKSMKAPNHLAAFYPASVLEHSMDQMLPASWHIFLNRIWAVQVWILFLHCIYVRRWVPCQWPSSRAAEAASINGYIEVEEGEKDVKPKKAVPWVPPWTVIQFWAMLVVHSVFYIIELDSTAITSRYVPMAYHHYFALATFTAYSLNANCFCVGSLLPFILHTLFWSLGADNYTILAAYNLCIVAAGFTGVLILTTIKQSRLLHSKTERRTNRVYAAPIGPLLPLLAIGIGSVNYYTYCMYYGGYFCDGKLIFSRNVLLNTVCMCFMIFSGTVIVAIVAGLAVGRTQYMQKIVEQEQVESYTETRYLVLNKEGKLVEEGGGRVSLVGFLVSWFRSRR